MFGLLALAASVGVIVIGFIQARAFVRERLRYVDAAQSAIAPIIAAFGALCIAVPAVALLPFVGGGTAIAFAVSIGLGVSSGQKDIRRALPPGA